MYAHGTQGLRISRTKTGKPALPSVLYLPRFRTSLYSKVFRLLNRP